MAASNDGVAHPDTAVPSDVNTTTTSAKKPGEGSIGQENTLNFDPSPVRSNDFAPMAEEPDSSTPELDNAKASADVTKPTLGSPFLSPKLIAGDDKTVPSLEDGELIVTEPKDSIRMNSDLVEEQEEQSVEKAELKLASPLDKKESLVASTPEVHVEIKKEVDIDTEDSDIKPDTDVAIESRKVSKPAHSLPPHMRPDFRSPPSRLFGLQDSRAMAPNEATRFNDTPRAPRSHYNSYAPRGDHGDREQSARMNAQLMKTKHELDAERTKNLRLRKNIEAEQQQKIEAASCIMLTNLLREQAEALTLKSRVEARERDLDLREQKISQLEVYLSEGQKQLMYALEENGDRPMSAVQMEHARREAELNAQKNFADLNGKLEFKIEAQRLREGGQHMREQHYKAMVREELQAELAETSISHEKAEEIADIEYNNGFGAGKEAGRKEALKESHQRGFLEGYGACHLTQVTLSKVRQGLIAHNDPTLDFLYDANHPHNLWNIGELVGRLERDDKVALMKDSVKKEMEDEKKTPVPSQKVEALEDGSAMDGKVNGHINGTNGDDGTNGVNGGTNGVVSHRPSSPISKMPPPRPTFAAELRGPSLTHNGHIVLANNSASPIAKETGRPIIKYEDKGVNLIDLM